MSYAGSASDSEHDDMVTVSEPESSESDVQFVIQCKAKQPLTKVVHSKAFDKMRSPAALAAIRSGLKSFGIQQDVNKLPLSLHKIEEKPLTRQRATQKKRGRSRRSSSSSSNFAVNSSSDEYNPNEDDGESGTLRARQKICYKDDCTTDEDEFACDSDDSYSLDSVAKKKKAKRRTDSQKKDSKPEKQYNNAYKVDMVVDGRMGKVGATGHEILRYIVDDSRDPNKYLPKDTPLERQFLIKWVSLSHLHNTWESNQSLMELKAIGLTKIKNFAEKEDRYNDWREKADPDEVDYQACQMQFEKELTKFYLNVERIIAKQINPDNTIEYFVKWECLPYIDATWETGELINRYYPKHIDMFEKRNRSTKIPINSYDSLKFRPKFVLEKNQPNYMKGISGTLVLRDYQLDGLNFLVNAWCRRNSAILGDEMGLGKTIQAICYLLYLFEAHNVYGPFLVIVPLSTMSAWQKEFALWAPQMNVVTYLGNDESRRIIRENEFYTAGSTRNVKFNALLTTYETVVRDKAILIKHGWSVMTVDEAHRLKNRNSNWHKTLADFESHNTVLMTGTPIQNSLEELWSLLHFIMPYKFRDWESFEQEHDQKNSDGFKNLHRKLEPFFIRRVKKDVEKSLPQKKEKILRVEMTAVQRQIYKLILTKNYAALKKEGQSSRQTYMNMVMQLRKCCNHSNLVKCNDIFPAGGKEGVDELTRGSGKLMLLDKLLVRLKSMGHRVLIFSQFVIMLDIIEELLELRKYQFQRLDGTTSSNWRQQGMAHFNAEGSKDFCFLLSTRAGGLGINLASANTVIIFDSDWNPQNDIQAQARAHRIGQTRQVNVYKLVTKNSVEENILERAKKKMILNHLVIQRMDTTGRTILGNLKSRAETSAGADFDKMELNAILKFGAEDLFKDDKSEDEYICDVDEILRIADEESSDETDERPSDDLLSAFKIVSFANDTKEWGEIIPEDVRERFEAEEQEREFSEYMTLQRSNRKARKKQHVVKTPTPTKKSNRWNKNKNGNDSDVSVVSYSLQPESDSSFEYDGDFRGEIKVPKVHCMKEPKKLLFECSEREVRRFVDSMKKFPRPLTRLDAIAKDANLTHKPFPLLQSLGKLILELVSQAMAATSGPSFCFDVFPNLRINAKSITRSLEVLEPLGHVMPITPGGRKRWKFKFPVTKPGYHVDWESEDDKDLLLAVWEHGFVLQKTSKSAKHFTSILESFPRIKSKLFPNESNKLPRVEDLHTRVFYLLGILSGYKPAVKSLLKNQDQNIIKKVTPVKKIIKVICPSVDPLQDSQIDLAKKFSYWEVRRFVKSFTEFPYPLARLPDISTHAMLHKPLKNLQELGEYLLEKCHEYLEETHERAQEGPCSSKSVSTCGDAGGAGTDNKSSLQKPCVILGHCFNPKVLLSRLDKLEGLGDLIPLTEAERIVWKFEYKVQPKNFSVGWGLEEDTRLLLGLWKHGISNVEAVRASDPMLAEKIFVEGDRLPNIKTILAHKDRLMTVINKNRPKMSKLEVRGPEKVKSEVATFEIIPTELMCTSHLLKELRDETTPKIMTSKTEISCKPVKEIDNCFMNITKTCLSIPGERNALKGGVKRKCDERASNSEDEDILNAYPELKKRQLRVVVNRLNVSAILQLGCIDYYQPSHASPSSSSLGPQSI